MQSSKEQQGEIRKLSSAINAKKQRKTIEWDRLEISSKKLDSRYFITLLQIAEKRKEAKGKGEKERYTHLNAEFQGIARRDKAFLSDQCKEIEGNNRMGKTRDFFKNITDTKGTFHAKMEQNNKEQKLYGPNRSRSY